MEAEESQKETEEKKIDMICKLSWWIYVYMIYWFPVRFMFMYFFVNKLHWSVCKQAPNSMFYCRSCSDGCERAGFHFLVWLIQDLLLSSVAVKFRLMVSYFSRICGVGLGWTGDSMSTFGTPDHKQSFSYLIGSCRRFGLSRRVSHCLEWSRIFCSIS